MANACGLRCELCPAAARCGGSSNFCLVGRCKGCEESQLSRMEVRTSVIRLLGGLDMTFDVAGQVADRRVDLCQSDLQS